MNEFISAATKNLGLNEDTTRKMTGGLFSLLQKNSESGDFSQLLGKLPGAENLLKNFSGGSGSASGSGLGGLMSMAGSLLGGKAGSALNIAGLFKQTGLNTDQAGSFLSMFINFIKDKAGADLISRVTSKIPELSKMLK